MSVKPLLSFVVGARPNFVKAAPVIHKASESGAFRIQTLRTGQRPDSKTVRAGFRSKLPEYMAIGKALVVTDVGVQAQQAQKIDHG